MRSPRVGVGPDVKLSEGRGRSIGLRVKTGRGGGLSVAGGEGVVAVISRHDELNDRKWTKVSERGEENREGWRGHAWQPIMSSSCSH
jgi:hypothetical protein